MSSETISIHTTVSSEGTTETAVVAWEALHTSTASNPGFILMHLMSRIQILNEALAELGEMTKPNRCLRLLCSPLLISIIFVPGIGNVLGLPNILPARCHRILNVMLCTGGAESSSRKKAFRSGCFGEKSRARGDWLQPEIYLSNESSLGIYEMIYIYQESHYFNQLKNLNSLTSDWDSLLWCNTASLNRPFNATNQITSDASLCEDGEFNQRIIHVGLVKPNMLRFLWYGRAVVYS